MIISINEVITTLGILYHPQNPKDLKIVHEKPSSLSVWYHYVLN